MTGFGRLLERTIHCEVMFWTTQDTVVIVVVTTGTNSTVLVLLTLMTIVVVVSFNRVVVISQRPVKDRAVISMQSRLPGNIP